MIRRDGRCIRITPQMSFAAFAGACQQTPDAVLIDLAGRKDVDDTWLVALREYGLHPEQVILSGTRVTDKGLALLVEVDPHLESLFVAGTRVTEAGLRALLRCPHLLEVMATDNAIAQADETIAALRHFTALNWTAALGPQPSDHDRVMIDWNHVRSLDPMY